MPTHSPRHLINCCVFYLLFALLLTASAADRAVSSDNHPPLRHNVVVDGHSFALWSRPVAEAKGVILLLHGRTWSALPDFDLQVPGQQRSVMQALNERGYTTYALDMRGYGASPRDASGWLTPDRAAADLVGVLRWIAAREQRKPIVLGWSYGALVSQLTVQTHPELASDLILLGYPRDPAALVPATESPAIALREVNTRERAASDFISPAVTPQTLIDAYVKAALAADPVRTDWRNLEQFNALDPAKITVPTLLMHGERDPLTPAAAQARLFTQLGTADKQWVVLPGGDHAALIEDTLPAFVAAVVAFIERPKPLLHSR
jgi:pimeloyl-ACP methyl ester carboxylesterase